MSRSHYRTVADVVREVQAAQAKLMNAPPSSRMSKVLQQRLERLAEELRTRTCGVLSAGPL